jgi:hypothetical protein
MYLHEVFLGEADETVANPKNGKMISTTHKLFALHGKSAAAYRELQESGALILPSERVLCDYNKYFKPKAGIDLENIESLCEKAATLTGIQRYLVLVMDEMKIQSNLVFDK